MPEYTLGVLGYMFECNRNNQMWSTYKGVRSKVQGYILWRYPGTYRSILWGYRGAYSSVTETTRCGVFTWVCLVRYLVQGYIYTVEVPGHIPEYTLGVPGYIFGCNRINQNRCEVYTRVCLVSYTRTWQDYIFCGYPGTYPSIPKKIDVAPRCPRVDTYCYPIKKTPSNKLNLKRIDLNF